VSATSSDAVPPPLSVPLGGRSNSICILALGCVLDSASDVQPLSLDLDAFLSDSINLDIISGRSLLQIREYERQGVDQGVNVHVVPAEGHSRKFQTVFIHRCG